MPHKVEVGCLRHPGASTIGSQLLDGDCSHGWQIHAEREKQAPVTLIKQWTGREGGTGGDSLQGVPMLRRNANAKKNTD